MKANTMKRSMRAGTAVIGAEIGLGCAAAGEMFSLAGFDFVQVDMQHGAWTDDTALQAFHHICAGPATPSVRVPDNGYAAIGRVLDRGALTVVVPMVNSAEEAQAAAQAVRYPPHGRRSMGGRPGCLSYGADYAEAVDDEICLMVQIETGQAVEAARDILSVDGVDGCMIGPTDLGNSLGPRVDPAAQARMQLEVRDICLELGRFPGIATGGPAAERHLREGFLFVLATGDYGILAEGAAQTRSRLDDVRSSLQEPR